jgi:hypothetical protein
MMMIIIIIICTHSSLLRSLYRIFRGRLLHFVNFVRCRVVFPSPRPQDGDVFWGISHCKIVIHSFRLCDLDTSDRGTGLQYTSIKHC